MPNTNAVRTAQVGAAPFFAGKNVILNGDFSIWQRGTSFSNPANAAFTADRFYVSYNGTGATRTLSQQTFTPGSAPVAGYEGSFFYRCNQAVAGTSQTFLTPLAHRIEDVRTLAGRTATLSFWAKADTNRTLNVGVSQIFGSGGSTRVDVVYQSVSITASWVRYTITFSMPSLSGKTIGTSSYVEVFIDAGNATAVQTLDFWGFQLEAGSVATAFETATGTIQGELAACQRYYWRSGAAELFSVMGFGSAITTQEAKILITLPVTMRRNPTQVEFSTIALWDTVTLTSITSVTLTESNFDRVNLTCVVASGLTVYRPYFILANNSTSGYVALSAEL